MAGAVLLGTVTHAYASGPAADLIPASADAASPAPASGASLPFQVPIPHKSYQFDTKRWGFRFDVDEPPNRQTDWKDVTAGAYFKISPSIRFGGSVGLGDRFSQPQQISPQDTGPRVHLETKFQF